MLECCVFHHAIKHCFKFLHDSQHGFFKGRSDTVAQLLGFLCKIKTTIIYLNFTKAFDRVSHPHLIQKLHHNHILGPLLFLMYIDELPPVIDCDSFIGMFADDSKCYRTILNSLDCTNLQNDLDVISEWSKDWRLRFNTSKCELLSITRKRNPIIHDYRLDSHSLTRPSSQKDLGITISKDLKWNSHINQAVSKGYRMLGFLRRHTNRHFDSETKKVLYRSLIRPHCGYASEVWAPSSIVNLKKVESLQRRATRFILPNSDLNYRDRLIKLNLIPLSYWREIRTEHFFNTLKDCMTSLSIIL